MGSLALFDVVVSVGEPGGPERLKPCPDGLLLAAVSLVLVLSGSLSISVPLILTSAFWFDASYTITIRALTGQNPLESHRLHLYQKLARRFGHGKVTSGLALYGACWLFPLAAAATYHSSVEWIALAAALTPLLALAVTMKAGVAAPGR